MSETVNFDNELKLLNKAVNEASEHTKRQFDAIDNFSLVAIVSIVIAFGITYQLQISKYWIPCAFFLIFMWGIIAAFKIKGNKKQKNSKEQVADISDIKPYEFSYNIELLIKNIIPFGNSLAIIYLLSLIFILLSPPQWINFDDLITIVPIFACIIWFFFPFIVDNFSKFLTKDKIKRMIDCFTALPESEKEFDKRINTSIGVLVIVAVYLILLVIPPLISLFITYPYDIIFIENIRYFLLIFILQFIALIIIARYFNALSVKKELANSLTNYADIHSFITYYLLSEDYEQKDVEQLKHLFFTAKRYDIAVDNSFKLINFYILLPHRVSRKEVSNFEERSLWEKDN